MEILKGGSATQTIYLESQKLMSFFPIYFVSERPLKILFPRHSEMTERKNAGYNICNDFVLTSYKTDNSLRTNVGGGGGIKFLGME